MFLHIRCRILIISKIADKVVFGSFTARTAGADERRTSRGNIVMSPPEAEEKGYREIK